MEDGSSLGDGTRSLKPFVPIPLTSKAPSYPTISAVPSKKLTACSQLHAQTNTWTEGRSIYRSFSQVPYPEELVRETSYTGKYA